MKNLLIYLVILIFSLLPSLPLSKSGLHVMHDDQQVARLFTYDEALKSGQIPVRWVDHFGFGFGYPLFVFYPPMVYILGEAFHLVGFTFISSIKFVFFISIFGSGIAMYIFSKEFFGKIPALASAFFYILVPYRAVDIYIRGALAESFSFVWLPLTLWSFYKISQSGKSIHAILAGIFLASLMITHNLVLLPFLIILFIYLNLLLFKSMNIKKTVINFFYASFLAAGLSAFFWIPALIEKKYTIVDQLLLVNLANYNQHFVYPLQLWNWPWGFGGSGAGLTDGISFKIGKLHIVLSALSALIVLFCTRRKGIHKKYFTLIIFFLLIFSAFMTTFYSKFVWDIIKPLGYLQFPWRFLIFTALFSSFLAGAFIHLLRLPILRYLFFLITVLFLMLPNLKLFKPQINRPNLTDEIISSPEYINWYISDSSFEYAPRGLDLKKNNLGANTIDISKNDLPKQKVEILEGNGVIFNENSIPGKVELSLDAKNQTKLKFNVFNFPGWQAKINGVDAVIEDNNKYKLITMNIPEGMHNIKLEFKETPLRRWANIISTLSIALTAFIIIKTCRKTY